MPNTIINRLNGREKLTKLERGMEMDKLELIIKLTELGYKAELIDGLPYIIGLNYPQTEKLVRELGYKGSYGIRKE